MLQTKEVVSHEQLDRYIGEAARAAGYEAGFGVTGCDLSLPHWWAAYIRQSREEQAQNNRIPEYLLTCARLAKQKGVPVPREYVVDHESSDYLDRRHMLFLRRELIEKRRIAGVIIPEQGRLSGNSLNQQVFEKECEYYGVDFLFGDAPSGKDWASAVARQFMAHANQLRLQTTRKGARGGNIGRALKGLVPAYRAAYGYRYRRDAEIAPDGRVRVIRAWWEVDELGPDGNLIQGSPAWVVVQMFDWAGDERRSLHWVANKLNEMGIKTAEGGKWSPSRVAKVVHRPCYTGQHAYNVNARVPNPQRPLGDITAEVKRTLLRPKPREEWVTFKVPALVTGELWQKANANITERGRGRGKQGKSLQALLRSRIFCPRCGKPMVVRRGGHQKLVYYHCSRYYQPWAKEPCNYKRFIPGTWEDLVWEDICKWLSDDAWVEQQLVSEHCQDENVERLIRLQQFKVSQAQARIARVQEGFEGRIYSLDEAKRRIADHQKAIDNTESEIRRLKTRTGVSTSTRTDIEAMRQELKALRDRNLDGATFEEKLDIISKLGIKVYPSEDLKSMRVACQLNLEQAKSECQLPKMESSKSQADGEFELASGCRKVHFGPPTWMRTGVSRCT